MRRGWCTFLPFPELKRGARGDDVGQLQSLLNRTGAMLLRDGDFGGGTERAVRRAQGLAGLAETGIAVAALWTWLEARPEPSPLLPADCVACIAVEETGGLLYYEAVACRPHWPGEESGITIGIGYDLRFAEAEDFRTAWQHRLPPAAFAELAGDVGRRGTKARVAQLRQAGVRVPFDAAWEVFVGVSLPQHHARTEGAFPSLPSLPDWCRTVLVSLVFNRGPGMRGPGREEMRAIRDLLAAAAVPGLGAAERRATLAGVEDQLLSMKRLWPPASGLVRRRQNEANLWRRGLAAC
jgi:peptidoglycan hydrolase-like protein with peptidoglycan-binding domain